MKIRITFDVDLDARMAVALLSAPLEGLKPATREQMIGWIQATIRSTLEEVSGEYATRVDAAELRAQWDAEDE